ncbi:MAG: ABC transporter permease [Gammaproteobacteria bacterium]|nr:ABC transporter permease [Gammaproteobacteria bacterium]
MKPACRLVTMLVILIFLWQGIVMWWEIPAYFLPTPYRVFQSIAEQKYLLLMHAGPTVLEIILGFFCGVILGIAAGALATFSRTLTPWVLPLLIMSQAIPTFAIAPVIVIWLGFGLSSKVAITALMIFFPVMSAMYDGLRQTPPYWLELAKNMQATPLRIFCFIRFPAALPSLASGLRIAAVIAPIGAIVGEWVGSSRGLGFLMINANARLQIDQMFAALSILMLLALGLYFTTDYILRKLIWWEPST